MRLLNWDDIMQLIFSFIYFDFFVLPMIGGIHASQEEDGW